MALGSLRPDVSRLTLCHYREVNPNGTLPMRLPLSLALLLLAASPAHAQSIAPVPVSADATVLHVQAIGHASSIPDVARLSAGVVTRDISSTKALAESARVMTELLAIVRKAGVREQDIRTDRIELSPQYHYTDKAPPALNGYQATNMIHLTVRDMSRVGNVIDALVAGGANQVDGPHFAIETPTPLEQKARLAALETARQQADTYARALGLTVRRVLTVQEGDVAPVHSGAMKMAFRSSSVEMSDTPIAAGKSEVQVNLSVAFELGR